MMVQIPTQTNPTMMPMRGEGSPHPSLNMIFLNLSMDHYPSVRNGVYLTPTARCAVYDGMNRQEIAPFT